MELSEEIIRGLNVIADNSNLNEAQFTKLAVLTIEILLRLKTEEILDQEFNQVDKLILKQGYASLSTVILEAAKINIDGIALKGLLKESQLAEQRIGIITKVYEEKVNVLRSLLATTAFTFPHIVDVDWRLDYQIKTNKIEKVGIPLYFINLQTINNNNESKVINFSCTAEELQDFVTKLKDATKQIERMLPK
eukprot:TRINITY_DN5993_c2_g1_i3.p1 TRINITY_DN5993_c2_g1~~TRINITY_DN5993_c2_g1_i3.p1  ORF type:complete len:193 (+),score=92.80 TRINITY_DN5993_c2_g1_i3:80-658(+)